MFDLLIKNAYIADGTGNPGYNGDLAVENGYIAVMGHLPAAQAATTIDASGKVLCPGFIDVHVHSEVEMLAGRHTAGVQMGVTTDLICPDGMTFAPLSPEQLADYRRYVFGIYGDADIGWDWRTWPEYLECFTGIVRNNFVTQVPHGVIRLIAMGWKPGPANDDELAIQRRLAHEFMEAGACGFNTGLGYAPAANANAREMAEICKVVAEYGGLYAAHMRNYGDTLDASIAETCAIAEAAGVPVHINHFGGTPSMYASAEAARKRGIDITWDAYPYQAGCTLFSYAMPLSMFNRGTEALLHDLHDPAVRQRLEPALEAFFPPDGSGYFAYLSLEHNKWMEGLRAREVWQRSGKSFTNFYCDLLIEEDLAPLLIYPWPGEQEVKDARLRNSITHPLQMFSTDGIYVGSHTHPRGYGSYAMVLGRYVRELGWLRLEDAIRRMSSFPAARFGLADRGLLRKGMAADMVIFDPQTVMSPATYDNPRLPPVGIEHVFVNGEAVVSNNALTDKRPGRLLRASF